MAIILPSSVNASEVRAIGPDQIDRNPENPRLFFRSDEMDTLLRSIQRFGIQVPVTVYREGRRYTLIDGERRWRCALKLNLKAIPALVQPKPSPLNNLLLMFNIHALREQWDYFTIANKLPNVIKLFKREEKREPTEIELSEITGLTRGQIRRCRYLADMPEKYRAMLATELELPKQKQQLSEDVFIEMERALKTVSKRLPETISNLDAARDALIHKVREKVISNVTHFRMLSKIATSISNVGVKESRARSAIRDILSRDNEIGIEDLYSEYFELKYDEKKIARNIESISDFLESQSETGIALDEKLRKALRKLQRLVGKVLGS